MRVDRGDRWALLALLAAVGGLLAGVLVAVLVATDGHLTYALDDPYIHLALAQHIAAGDYGINAGEASSPSSSVLWPLLLAGPTLLPHDEVWPLVLAAGCTLATAVALFGGLARSLPRWWACGATLAAVVLLNVVGIAFTGMEHSLQVLLAVLVGRGVVEVVADPARVPRSLLLAVAAGPLVRYELAAFSLAAAVVLVAVGRGRMALLPTLVWVVSLLSFSVFLVRSGLDALPSSVLAKSGYADVPLVFEVRWRVETAFTEPVFVLVTVVVLGDALLRRTWGPLHTFAVLVLGAHLVAGDFGWFGRYEVYLYVGLLPVLVALLRPWAALVRSRLGRPWTRRAVATALAATAVATAYPLASTTLSTPAAARDVWSQQAQTADFVRQEWRLPIAVNDLGLVALRGGQPVLDLYGLADQDARKARQERTEPGWMDRLVRERGVRLVAIYSTWFPDLPQSWTRVGTLTGSPVVVSGERTVDLYVVDETDAPTVCAELVRFAARTASRWTEVRCTWSPEA